MIKEKIERVRFYIGVQFFGVFLTLYKLKKGVREWIK